MSKEKQSSQYSGKVMLAPMVRVCSLPMRLLALDYGADLVYTEEIIDRKLLICHEYKNELLGTIDFTMSDGTVVFRTCAAERGKVIFQLGTSDAKRALAAAKKIQHLVAGVDVNMGCPKEFSIKGGMGAALLTQQDKVKSILTTLVNGLDVPVTCKIRVLPDIQETVALAKLIESTGVSAIGVHGRTKSERSRDPNRDDYIKAVSNAVSIPVIANGGSKNISNLSEVESFRLNTEASSVMLARAAMWNCSVFRRDGPLPFIDVLKSYLRYAFLYDNNVMNTKYCVLQIIHDKMTEIPEADFSLSAKSLQEFADIWHLQEDYRVILHERQQKEMELSAAEGGDCRGVKKKKTENGLELIELPVRYDKTLYNSLMTPKQILNNYCIKHQKEKPVYSTTERYQDRFFKSVVQLEGKLYTNPFWERSKQLAEQSAAVCCLVVNGLDDGRTGEPKNETEELRRKWRDIVNSKIVSPSHCSDEDAENRLCSATDADLEKKVASQSYTEIKSELAEGSSDAILSKQCAVGSDVDKDGCSR
ncbi:tRNA-dihydrouridine(20) synthase [NAD(P)+]-like protein [Biomphalaria glabrata]|uniref:tRNA-dihydrouridine(20) synthase [NAD(P)+]-like n=1 Tax=Biomphalaria glabrata TaxID=6526 RepID=A0A9W3AUH2_BIOGL|nr:tRNA-dihydrouridine(20) synthase [NAD(P)+]-like [Biomphalaria glabrata]XP_055890926.1 tRNA-dihydrouridine(20) synthase [NAD(P)+]-like [Biomphalaria glabrata]XP_055890927.1 tRNA-dihydrouridine(20) synthase [NAD(P)+]-like [Biomphalaria glabrata]XP_055890928.1 tRNA-dihydrouridine(20) synthase [NAD(P)+]-like [Biomphalaria glabrata]XP_055890929.1 tRNA-dihydrouridine(20) synthase [NAD(P)+]-like [Biomphalaria glabrata]XP_055890930.1 tRNA-dihydrouridine(20) synthase [NAD(P)+]-like [Biomphalaria gla